MRPFEIPELQKKRADNIIWTAAGNYTFTPDFKAYDDSGLADLYFNCIIGAARKYYDYPKFEALFETLDDDSLDVFWTALEKVVYCKELPHRPALEMIREDYESPLVFSEDMDTDEIVAAAKEYFLKTNGLGSKKRKRRLLGIRKGNKAGSSKRHFKGLLWHPRDLYGASTGDQLVDSSIKTKLTAEELREFMETKYGKPLYSASVMADLERQLCRGNHAGCHIHITGGERIPSWQVHNGFEALSRQREAAIIEGNKKYYSDHLLRNRIAISRLSSRIQNSMLLHLQPSPVKSNTGALNGRLVWRAAELDDEKIFIRNENDNKGDLCVDILLDASTSQQHRTAVISSQALIIAQSLTDCGIPCRIMSFCSMTGYTIMRIFRDYNRPADNANILEFVSNGCNRDGLGIRIAAGMIAKSPYEHRILIILSDVKPNDVVKMRGEEGSLIPYEKLAGLTDTAHEVRKARAEGISVICIFTGEDEDLPSAKIVYDRDFVRIHSFDMMADAVGNLLQQQIKNL